MTDLHFVLSSNPVQQKCYWHGRVSFPRKLKFSPIIMWSLVQIRIHKYRQEQELRVYFTFKVYSTTRTKYQMEVILGSVLQLDKKNYMCDKPFFKEFKG